MLTEFFIFFKHVSEDMFLSNFTQLACPSILNLGPLLKKEMIAENGSLFIHKKYEP